MVDILTKTDKYQAKKSFNGKIDEEILTNQVHRKSGPEVFFSATKQTQWLEQQIEVLHQQQLPLLLLQSFDPLGASDKHNAFLIQKSFAVIE